MKTFQILLEQIVTIKEGLYKNNRRIESLMTRLSKGVVREVKGGKKETIVQGFSPDSLFHAVDLYMSRGAMSPDQHPLHREDHPLHETFKNLITASKGKLRRNVDLATKGVPPDRESRFDLATDPSNNEFRAIRRLSQQKTSADVEAQKKGLLRGSSFLPPNEEYLRFMASRLTDRGRN
jgi:hypothetical protein